MPKSIYIRRTTKNSQSAFYQHIHINIRLYFSPEREENPKELPNFEFEAAPNPSDQDPAGAPTEKPL